MTSMKSSRKQLNFAYNKYKKYEHKLSQAKKKLESQVKENFNAMDTEKNGTISVNEFMAALVSYDKSLSVDELTKYTNAFKKTDINNSNTISFDEALKLQYIYAGVPYTCPTQ